jgi:hypothetical protein
MKPRRHCIGVDQNDTIYRRLIHPRKDLLERLGRKHAEKIYFDRNGTTYHCGYLIAGRWVDIYQRVEEKVSGDKSSEI